VSERPKTSDPRYRAAEFSSGDCRRSTYGTAATGPRIHGSATKKISPPNETAAIARTTNPIRIAARTRAVGTNPRRDKTLCGTSKRSVRTASLLWLRRLTGLCSREDRSHALGAITNRRKTRPSEPNASAGGGATHAEAVRAESLYDASPRAARRRRSVVDARARGGAPETLASGAGR
jgi:hypothetical protein